MKPIVLKEDENGKVVITADDIQKMVEDAYNAGYVDGSRSCLTIVNQQEYPINITPSITWERNPYIVTC